MPQDKVVAKYQVRIYFTFTPVNKYGDELKPEGTLQATKELEVKSMTELAAVLAQVDHIGK